MTVTRTISVPRHVNKKYASEGANNHSKRAVGCVALSGVVRFHHRFCRIGRSDSAGVDLTGAYCNAEGGVATRQPRGRRESNPCGDHPRAGERAGGAGVRLPHDLQGACVSSLLLPISFNFFTASCGISLSLIKTNVVASTVCGGSDRESEKGRGLTLVLPASAAAHCVSPRKMHTCPAGVCLAPRRTTGISPGNCT